MIGYSVKISHEMRAFTVGRLVAMWPALRVNVRVAGHRADRIWRESCSIRGSRFGSDTGPLRSGAFTPQLSPA